MRNVDTIFALEFGQLLENHLFASPNRDAELEIIISSLNLKTKNQLAQVFAGYDVPTTASIFELIRTLNNPEFTERFFNLKAVNLGVQHALSTQEVVKEPEVEKLASMASDDLRNQDTEDFDFDFSELNLNTFSEIE